MPQPNMLMPNGAPPMQGGQGGGLTPPQMGGMPPPVPPMPPQQPQMPPPENQSYGGTQDFDLSQLLTETNIAEKLDEKRCEQIARDVCEGYDTDVNSRSDWERKYDEWLALAMQVREIKTFPWAGASNIKYPVLSTAAMQFAARAYPALIPANGQIVNYRVVGEDPQGQKAARAKRISQYMSWQLLDQMRDWEEDMDRMMIMLPIIGCAFKKTYWDSKHKRNSSHLVHAKDLVVNYWAKSLEDCERKTQKYRYTKRQLEEKMRAGIFLDIELPEPDTAGLQREDKLTGLVAGNDDDATPYFVLEQHTFCDLDDDGYAEPYVISVLKQDQKLLRISARWDSDGVKRDENGKIVCIYPVEYYTKYSFIPNPDGGFYDVGFGLLLGPLNESVNTLINQLVDAGTIANLQGGWISKGLRVKQGDQRFKPGEWKQVDAALDDLKKGIFPLPVKEPSSVLFQLLGTLVTSAKELASVAEIFTGKMPGQNTPAYTTKETVEQGMKVFTAIYKRCYRSFSKELKKLYRLNQVYKNQQEEASVTDSPMAANDFNGPDDDIVPAADPQASSMADKVQKARGLLELLQTGTLDPKAVVARVLEAMEIPNVAELQQKQPPPPPPEVQKMQMEGQMKQQEQQAKMKMAQDEHQLKMQEMQMELQIEQQKAEIELKLEQAKFEIEKARLQMEMQKFQMEMQQMGVESQMKQHVAQQDMAMQNQQHEQKMVQGEMSHIQKLEQTKEAAKAKPQGGVNGTKGTNPK